MVLSPQDAADAIVGGLREPITVHGRLELKEFRGNVLPPGLHCYDLDASDSRLEGLPKDIRVDSRLVLDNCTALKSLPRGLSAGSISLRNCPSLQALPEDLGTWFLDMTACTNFETWPSKGTINHGSLILRGCVNVRTLPTWIGRLSHLDLAGCTQISDIPDGISVSSWVDIGGTRITKLPPSLEGAALKWRGVRIDERIAFHPEQLSAAETLAEKNAERRRVMIERMGYARFAKEAGAKVLDEDKDAGGKRQLLFIDLRQDEPLVGLWCRCPSTGRQYFLRVPPKMKKCHDAAAWIAGFDNPRLYRPQIET